MPAPRKTDKPPPKRTTVKAKLLGMPEANFEVEGPPEHQQHVVDKLYTFWQPLIEEWTVEQHDEGKDDALGTRVADGDRRRSDGPSGDTGERPDDAG